MKEKLGRWDWDVTKEQKCRFLQVKSTMFTFYWFRQIGELGVEEWIDIPYALIKLLWLLFCEKSAGWGMAKIGIMDTMVAWSKVAEELVVRNTGCWLSCEETKSVSILDITQEGRIKPNILLKLLENKVALM